MPAPEARHSTFHSAPAARERLLALGSPVPVGHCTDYLVPLEAPGHVLQKQPTGVTFPG